MTLQTIHKDAAIFKPAFEYQESTLQLPFGEFSILSELKAGRVSPIEAMVTLVLCYRSYWETGFTWRSSSRKVAELLHISQRYVRSALENAAKWVQRKTAPKGNVAGTFRVVHHGCEPAMVPMDKNNRPKSFAVPRGKGGIFERLFAGDISWKACLVWLMLKLHSDWTTGVTDPVRMKTLAEWTGFSKKTVCDAIRTLRDAGMLERLSKRWECSVFQLYPKPYKSRAARRREKRRSEKWEGREMRADGVWRYSLNELYRLNVETAEIERRAVKGRGQWRLLKDRERHRMPKVIRVAFEQTLEAVRGLGRFVGGSDSAGSGSDGAGGGSHCAHPYIRRGLQGASPLRL